MKQNSLTVYPEGGIRELWSIALPLMVSGLASLFMIFTDRLFLSRYSLDALNASVNAGTLAWAVIGGVGMIAAMSEVFVAQYNGAQQTKSLGTPVWQMIWFSLFSYVIFIPLGLSAPWIFLSSANAALEVEYFRWLMFFGPSYGLMAALAGFFIGRGQTKILIALAIIANVINIFLDWVLIFGFEPYVSEMGVRGAAIATCLGYAFQAGMLAFYFLRKENRDQFGTGNWGINRMELKKCCRIGIPQGIFYGLEIFGWAVFFWMMTSLSKTHITVSSICQSLMILLSFFYDGLSRAVSAVSGNFLGSGRNEMIWRVLRSGLYLQLAFSLVITVLFFFQSTDLVHFLFFEHALSSPDLDSSLLQILRICITYTLFHLFFEGIRWILAGILVAAGDTLFLLIAGTFSVWVFLLLPVYLVVVQRMLSVEYAWLLAVTYSMGVSFIYWVRYSQGAWKKISFFVKTDQKESVTGIESLSSEPPKN